MYIRQGRASIPQYHHDPQPKIARPSGYRPYSRQLTHAPRNVQPTSFPRPQRSIRQSAFRSGLSHPASLYAHNRFFLCFNVFLLWNPYYKTNISVCQSLKIVFLTLIYFADIFASGGIHFLQDVYNFFKKRAESKRRIWDKNSACQLSHENSSNTFSRSISSPFK